ncbi:MAG: hypothetical protein WDO73_05590 [Ignavibacteriota bacterium]
MKNWAIGKSTGQTSSNPRTVGNTPGLVFIAVTPCRVMDTRGQGGLRQDRTLRPPSLVGGQPRIVPVSGSSCGVPAAVAYSLNVVSISPVGQPVGWVAAWQDDTTWPGTVILNSLQVA